MGICKIKNNVGLCLLLLSITGCTEQSVVSQEQYDDVLREYNKLKQSVEDAQNSNIRQAQTLSQTLEELAKISGTTETLRFDLERGKARLTQAEEISRNIEVIKKKIDNLQNKVQDKTYVKMVNNLKAIIREKEIEIEDLKQLISKQQETIKVKEETISEQSVKIVDQRVTISEQERQLKATIAQLAASLNQAGKDFEQMGDDIPDVTRKKNKQKVESWASSMYSTAIIYYKKAESYGHRQSEYDRQRVEGKLLNLKKHR